MLRPLHVLALVSALLPLALPAQEPATRPEATQYTETSSVADVQRFVDEVVKLPHGDRLSVEVAGKSHEGRAQLLIKVALPTPDANRLRAVVIGNIHAGEVEGKEAVQVLLREFANGDHEDVLKAFELWFLPLYNIDGNEKTSKQNRPGQNGPATTGQRPNAQGFDLNRDFIKAEAPETQTLLGLFARIDPHLFVDLHTTNGSYHGYHLTFAPSLSPNCDPAIARLSRAILDDSTAEMQQKHKFAIFDYGNFETHDWDGSGAPESAPGVRGWYTYDSRPRYGVNYFGLRNRIGILSEAYSYCDFATRIAATRAFVLTILHSMAVRAADVRQTCSAADQRLVAPEAPAWFGFDTAFGDPEQLPVLLGEVDTVPPSDGGTQRFVRKGDGKPETMPVLRSFRARQQRVLPLAWAIQAPTPEVLSLLQRHGIQFTRAESKDPVVAERFAVTQKKKPKRPYQGHQELVLVGAWQPAQETTLPAGTLLVSARQPLARLAAQLLEPESEDSLSTWNFFEARTEDSFPVLRIVPK
jgi:hypothetical protein